VINAKVRFNDSSLHAQNLIYSIVAVCSHTFKGLPNIFTTPLHTFPTSLTTNSFYDIHLSYPSCYRRTGG
jgi:hypothetical protein